MEIIIKNNPWFVDILKKPELKDKMLLDFYIFYLSNNNIYKILPIITSNSRISIRVLDWFVTNYAKKKNITYELKNYKNYDDSYFNVHLRYKLQLKAYNKTLFDPFCRKERIAFYYDKNVCVITTIGQLNFFMWAITNEVLTYVETHIDEITNDMINSHKYIINMTKEITEKENKNNNKHHLDDNDDIINISTNSSILNLSESTNEKSSKIIKPHICNKNKILKKYKQSTSCNDSEILSKVSKGKHSETKKIRQKRHELSSSANKTIYLRKYSVTLTFD